MDLFTLAGHLTGSDSTSLNRWLFIEIIPKMWIRKIIFEKKLMYTAFSGKNNNIVMWTLRVGRNITMNRPEAFWRLIFKLNKLTLY